MKIILLVFLISSSISYSQKYYDWVQKQLPAPIIAMVAATDDSLLILTDELKLFKSINGGESWGETGTNIVLNVNTSLFFLNGRLFISTKVGTATSALYYSDNFGTTFSGVVTGTNDWFERIDMFDGGLVASSSESTRIYQSSNNGLSWSYYTDIPLNNKFTQVTSSGDFYCVLSRRIFKLNKDSGAWENIYDEDSVSKFAVIEDTLLVLSNDAIHYSVDAGENWFTSDTTGSFSAIYKGNNKKLYVMNRVIVVPDEYEGVFELKFSPFRMEQVCSRPENNGVTTFSVDGMYYNHENNLYIRGEEYFPEFKTTYCPLTIGNEWLYREDFYDILAPEQVVLVKHYKTTHELNYAGRIYFDGYGASEELMYSFDSVENKFYELDIVAGIKREISFNYFECYSQAEYNDILPYYYIPMFDKAGEAPVAGLTLKCVDLAYPFEIAKQSYEEYLEGFGLYTLVQFDLDGSTINKELMQAKIYTSEDNFIMFDSVEDPSIQFYQPHQASSQILNFNVLVGHSLNWHGRNNEENFIKSLKLEYFYENNGTTTDVDTTYFVLDSLIHDKAVFSLDFDLDTNKIGGHDRFLKYRLIAETKGIFPHFGVSPAEGWHELEYIPTSVENDDVVYDYFLSANYPNPFNPSTRMEFTLPKESDVEIAVYNVTGELLFTVAKGNYKAGEHEININMGEYPSGIYFVSIQSIDINLTSKICLLK